MSARLEAILRPGSPLAERTVVPYDFRRPIKLNKEQLRTLEVLHGDLAASLAGRLLAELRLPVSVEVAGLEQLVYGEYMEGLDSVRAFWIASLPPVKTYCLAHLDEGLTASLLDRLFGSPQLLAALPDQATAAALSATGLSEAESAATGAAGAWFLAELAQAWRGLGIVDAKLVQVESQPRLCQILPPSEMMIRVRLNLRLGNQSGQLNVIYPFLFLEPLLERLKAQAWYGQFQSAGQARGGSPALARQIRLDCQLACALGPMTVAALRGLAVGDELPLPAFDAGLAELRAGGALVAELAGLARQDDALVADFRPTGGLATDAGAVAAMPGDPLANLALDLKSGLAAIQASLGSAVRGLSGELAGLQARQDELSDRVLYGQADLDELPAGARRPFAALAGVAGSDLALLLSGERCQLQALLLSLMDSAQAAACLSLLPADVQTEVVRRLAGLDWVPPAVLPLLDAWLAGRLRQSGRGYAKLGGVAKVVEILNQVPRAVEGSVITQLDTLEPALAESIKCNMFVFEDICLLDDDSIAAVLARAPEQDMLLALKGVAEKSRAMILARFPAAIAERLGAALKAMGRVRLSDADAAGFRVVEVIKQLEGEGQIVILRADE